MTRTLRTRFSIVALLFFSLWQLDAQAQLGVSWTNNAATLVNTITGPGIFTANPFLVCPGDSATGLFNGVGSNIGLSGGIILTSGSYNVAPGPNNSGSAGVGNGGQGDIDLNLISSPDSTFDACALHFDITATCDTLSIRYVFASEEYDEYVCASVNDVFGFFITGPGYPTPTNVAVVPGTSTPVSINTVNIGAVGTFGTPGPGCVLTNSAFYTSNAGGASVQYDGFTVGLTAKAVVQPCSTYHIKLVIADGGDDIFDSAVFLEELGFACASATFGLDITANGNLIEGCLNDTIVFHRVGDTINANTVAYTVSGTATNGVDYNNLPGTVTFPANSSTVSIPLSATLDGIAEGQETLIVIVSDSVCGAFASDTVTILLNDNPIVDAGPDVTVCGTDSGLVGLAGPINPGSYSWAPSGMFGNPGSIQSNAAASTPGTYTLTLTYTDLNGCEAEDSLTFLSNAVPVASFTAVSPICIGTSSTINFTGTAGSGASYNWNFGGGTVNSGSGAGPYQVSWSTVGNPLVTLQVTENNCPSGIDSFVVQVGAIPNLTFNTVNPPCPGASTGSATVNTVGGFLPLTFAWSTGGVTSTITNQTAGTYTVTVTDFAGCAATGSVTLTDPPALSASINPTNSNCNSAVPDGTAQATVNGGTPPYTYLWSNGFNTPFIQGLGAGNYGLTITDANGCVLNLSTTILQNPSPVINAGPDVSFCEGSGGAQLTSLAGGTTAPYYYQWWCDSTNTFCGLDSIFDNDPIANPTQTTTYYVQATDFNGCLSNIDSLIVTVLPKPIVDAGPDLYICGDSAPCQLLNPTILNVPGPFQYQWSPSIGLSNDTIPTPCARPDTTTIYTLVVVDANGCASDFNTVDTLSTVVVHVPPIPIANAGPDRDICLGDSIELQGYGYGAGPLYDFEWSPSTGLTSTSIPNPVASPAATTEYILTVWSNGCPSYGDTVRINVHNNPTVDAGPVVEICVGEIAILHGFAGGDSTATYTYNWSPPTGVIGSTQVQDLQASPSETMTYVLTSTSSYGCIGVDSVTLVVKPTPIAEAGPQQTICLPDSVTLQGSYTSNNGLPNPTQVYFAWTPGLTVSDTTQSNPQAWPGSSQFYYLTVRYNTCATTDSVLITVIPDLNLEVEADTSVACEGTPVQLTATAGIGGANFTWIPATGLSDPNSDTPIATPGTTTTYQVIATESGCSDTAEVALEIIPLPVPAYLSSLPNGCAPLTVHFSQVSTGATFYTWQFGDGSPVTNTHNPVHTFTDPGSYTVSLTAVGAGGCKATLSDLVVNVADPSAAEFTSDPTYPVELQLPASQVQFTDRSQHSNSWVWDFGDGFSSHEQNPMHTFQQPGQYTVTLTVMGDWGCESTVQHGPYTVVTPDLFIPNVFTPNDDDINDRFIVRYTGNQPFTLQIMDRWGGLLYESRNKVEGWDGKNLKGVSVPEGVYYYVITVADKKYTGEVTLLR